MPDAVVVGSGPNGLVGANVLADHGWTVVVLEAQDEPGGAVRTDSAVQPGFRHDTFSAFYPLAVASPAFRSLGLERYGLEWMRAPAVLGNPLPDSGWALLHRDPERTAAGLDTCHRGDGAAWLRLCQKWEGFGPDLVGAALSPFPPVRSSTRAATGLLRHLGPAGLTLPLQSVRRLAGSTFGGEAARLLLAGNALHADFSPHDLGSGTFGLILAMLGQTVGYPVPRGGAAALTQALVRRLESRGGSVVTRSEVAGVVIRAGRC
ncbi:MAG TPA: NAD(P)/FAD-dependent oxidoreductase, partial [Nocardioidaceae bacterium]